MILVILGICLLILAVGILLYYKTDTLISILIIAIGIISSFISLAATFTFIGCVSSSACIDDKITMYQEENKSIESSIGTIVENYQDYEQDIFKDVKPESYITIATQVYPDLKSNELVKKQIDIYLENNKKIKQLKEEKISAKISKWWLYFGS